MKKRLVALTLVAAMALGMTACGSKSNNKTTTNDNSDTAVSTAVDWTSYDELVESIRTEADLAKRAEMMHQAEDMLMDTWCVIPLYYYNDQGLCHRRILNSRGYEILLQCKEHKECRKVKHLHGIRA